MHNTNLNFKEEIDVAIKSGIQIYNYVTMTRWCLHVGPLRLDISIHSLLRWFINNGSCVLLVIVIAVVLIGLR